MKTKLLVGLTLGLLLIFNFQNCSNVNIQKLVIEAASQAPLGKIGARICPSLSANGKNYGFKLKQAYVVNLTSLPVKNALTIDSDMDGISDVDEIKDGFNPIKSRSFGMLDVICLKTGGVGGCAPPPGCLDASLSPGLTGCDLANFRASNANGKMTGLDRTMMTFPIC